MEGLNQMFKITKDIGAPKGFKITDRGEQWYRDHPFTLRDDSLVLCDADIDQVKHLRTILVVFEAVSGLHVNRH